MKPETPRSIHLKDYRPPAYLIDTVALDFNLDKTRTRVRSRLSVRPNPDVRGRPGPLRLDGENFELASITLGRTPLGKKDYKFGDAGLTLLKPPAGPFTLEIVTFVRPGGQQSALGPLPHQQRVLHAVRGPGLPPHHLFPRPPRRARHLHGAHRGRPQRGADAARPTATRWSAARSTAASATTRSGATPSPSPATCSRWSAAISPRIASDFRTASGRKVELRHLRRARQGGALRLGHGFAQARRCAGTRSASGASTTSTCSTSSPCPTSTWARWRTRASTSSTTGCVLASPETATDSNFAAIERVIAHEYFHNWTGNRITCRDWFQLCLKEGLTVFRDQEFCADERSRTVQRITRRAQSARRTSSPRTPGPLAHPVRPDSYIEINNFYTATVYEKGAEVVRMLQTLLGPRHFPQGHGPLLRAPRRRRRRRWRISSPASRT